MKQSELLAPAGSPEALDAAIGEGADAVYLGLKTFNARLRSSNFAFSQFEAAVEALHRQGKKLYATVNTVFEEREADRIYQLLQYLSRVGPDGIIVQDLGVARMAAREFPGLALHASTQMNLASAAGANLLSRIGFKRVVLSRELSTEEVAAVIRGTNLEVEVFVHGALCVSCSGLCLFSSFLGGKSANRGSCAQACRRLYHAEGQDGYFFSPDDLQLVARVPALVEAGVASLKIEGRMKSAEYVGTVVRAYRHMLDHWEADPEAALARAEAILAQDFARSKTEYFHASTEPDFIHPGQAGGTGISLGTVVAERGGGEGRMILASSLCAPALPPLVLEPGDSLRVHAKDDSERRTERVTAVRSEPDGLWISLSGTVGMGDSLYVIQTKAMSKRYKPVLPPNLDRYRRLPSHDAAPPVSAPPLPREASAALPEGLYAMTDALEDLYLFQSDPPVKAILRLRRSTSAELLERLKTLPFRGDGLIVALEPFFPESDAAWLEETVAALAEAGIKTFIANNLGHLTILRNRGLAVIAGEYLYAFNPWAAALLREQGAWHIVPPLEISKRDLQSVFDELSPSSAFLTVFAYPALFRIRADLSSSHAFREFSGREDESYELSAGQDGSIVTPRMPFSLTDRVEWLRKEGFRRLILDFSWIRLKKPLYKEVMKAARDSAVLPGALRFNWKDGFWNPEEPGGGSAGFTGRIPGKEPPSGKPRPPAGEERAAPRSRTTRFPAEGRGAQAKRGRTGPGDKGSPGGRGGQPPSGPRAGEGTRRPRKPRKPQ